MTLDENYEVVDTYSTYVKPEYGRIDSFIRNLTGITENLLTDAPLLEDALEELMVRNAGRQIEFYAWSDSDRYQLQHEIKAKGLCRQMTDYMVNTVNWVDYQKVFSDRFQMRNCASLQFALDIADIDFVGQAHDGLVDAINTASLIKKLENDPDFVLPEMYQYASDENKSTLNFSMGDLFSVDLLAQFGCV